MSSLNRANSTRAVRSSEPHRATLYRFLRNSHIFSSAVHEIFETKYLKDTCSERISLPQFHLLKLISLSGQHQIGKIADFLGVSSPAATKSIDKLERLGFVRRTACTTDRRATMLTATGKARELVNRYESHKLERLAPLIDKFSHDEIAELTRLMERFAVLLYAREMKEDGYCLRCAVYGERNCPIGQILGNCPYEKVRSRPTQGHAEEEST